MFIFESSIARQRINIRHYVYFQKVAAAAAAVTVISRPSVSAAYVGAAYSAWPGGGYAAVVPTTV